MYSDGDSCGNVATTVSIETFLYVHYTLKAYFRPADSYSLSTFFRYAVQMLTPARILAETCGREKVGASDVMEVDVLFKDAKQSAQLLARSEGWLK